MTASESKQGNQPYQERPTEDPEVSVVMPCLNEAQSIGRCIEKALEAFQRDGIRGEIVVADNGSTDDSLEICRQYPVRVVHQPKRGYGNSYLKGIDAAVGKYIVMADSDDTYDLREIGPIVEKLREGYDLVMGNRFKGVILPGAMPWSHRYIGNPILSRMVKIMFSTHVGDSHSGIRGLTREAYRRLGLRAPGMEFASEMVINAAKLRLRVAEVPVTYYPRVGSSKLRTVRDGWRHLRYMLLRSPTHLFVAPGLLLMVAGMMAMVPFLWGPVYVAGHPWDIHAMLFIGICTLTGYQVLALGLYAKLVAVKEGIDVEDKLVAWIRSSFKLEEGVIAGVLVILLGAVIGSIVVSKWLHTGFGPLSLTDTRLAFFGFMGATLGVQTIFSSFYLLLVQGLHADER